MTETEIQTRGSRQAAELNAFMDTVPVLERFRDGANPDLYLPLPDDWLIATADVVSSTAAIKAGRYKAINMVGAGVIAAAMNTLGTKRLPFVFGGDGAAFAFPAALHGAATTALSAMRRWAQDETDLELRAAIVPLAEIRAAKSDVGIARFAVSPDLSYTMFAGGGLSWADTAMKDGQFGVEMAPADVTPDLEGLSCRWQPIGAKRGEILSLIVVPQAASGPSEFSDIITQLLAILRSESDADGHPIDAAGPKFAAMPEGLDLEVRADSKPGSRFLKRIRLQAFALFAWSLFRFHRKLGRFDPDRYRSDTRTNTDFRKFDDGLKLTVDCGSGTAAKIQTALENAYADGAVYFGFHSQSSALMTCIVPSALTRDHIHFVDGAEGGYAQAAEGLKAQISAG